MTGRPANAFRLALAAILALWLASAALGQEANDLPNPRLTPGEIDPSFTNEDVCTPGFAQSIRPSRDESNALKKQVFVLYAIPWSEHGFFELDHLVPLELGGTSNVANLWPEHWSEPWGATKKDKLENYLHDLVCVGQLSLETAQQMIARDWIAAYRQFLGEQ